MTCIDVTDEEVKALAQSILIRYGIDFTCYEPKSLKRRIIRILNLHNFSSIHQLWIKFLREPTFIRSFMNEISVGMTSMFRDPILWNSLKERLFNKYSNSCNPIYIWHAGCSTGEEVYSMGIVLKETNLLYRSKAFATDINEEAMNVAREGVYHKIKMIENERNYREYNAYNNFNVYFKTDGKNAKMNGELSRHVTFGYHNLITDPIAGAYDIIFCRNVMIYFDNNAKSKLIEKFYQALKPGGLFIIGFYDTSLPTIDAALFVPEDEDAKIFAKPDTVDTLKSLKSG